jgi:hypothetical protein
MAQGAYDHPAYLARQMINMGRTTAGATGTSGGAVFPYAMRIHGGAALVNIAGTSTGSGHRVDILVGTASAGQIALGTNTVGAGVNMGTTDANILVPAGTPVYLRNGTDATGVATVMLDATIDATGIWAG